MDDRQAGVLATKLGDHPASHPVVKQLGGIVRRVLGTAIADGAITGIALDESDKPVIVAVSNGRAIRLQAIATPRMTSASRASCCTLTDRT